MICSVCSLIRTSLIDPESGFRYWVCPAEAYHSCSAFDHTNVANPVPYVRIRDKRVGVKGNWERRGPLTFLPSAEVKP